jgi:hypothetical protein
MALRYPRGRYEFCLSYRFARSTQLPLKIFIYKVVVVVVLWVSVIPGFRAFVPVPRPSRQGVCDSVYNSSSNDRIYLRNNIKQSIKHLWMTGIAALRFRFVSMIHRHGMIYPESRPLGAEYGLSRRCAAAC